MKTQSRKEIIVDNLINIKKYGFSEVFSSEIPEDDPLEPARVLSQEKGFYRVVTDNGEKLAEVSGKFRFQTTVPSEYPVVGDFVLVNWNESGNSAIMNRCCHEKVLLSEKRLVNHSRNRLLLQTLIRYFYVWH